MGYPLFDLKRMHLSIADYICKVQTAMKIHFRESYGIEAVESDNTGVFTSPTSKIASIGVQVRHRLTNHGFAYNVTREPLKWFDQVVACGLEDVKAGCIADAVGRDVSMTEDLESFLPVFERTFGREVVRMDLEQDSLAGELIRELEVEGGKCDFICWFVDAKK